MNRVVLTGVLPGVAVIGLAVSDLVWRWTPSWLSQWSYFVLVMVGIGIVVGPALLLVKHGRPPATIGMYLATAGLVGVVVASKVGLPETPQKTANFSATAMFFIGSALTAISEAINRGKVTRDGTLGMTTRLVLDSIRRGLGANARVEDVAAHQDGASAQYDVSFSYASEQTGWVETVVDLLRDSGLRVYFDRDDSANRWGVDLIEYDDEIYRKRSRYCVVVVSADYARNVWSTHERRSAQARALMERRAYLLPVRFDDTELPGLLPTVGVVDARTSSAETVASLLQRKVAELDRV